MESCICWYTLIESHPLTSRKWEQMYHYVALHINDCIADWAVKASIIHKMLLIGQCSLSKTDTQESNFRPHTHTHTELLSYTGSKIVGSRVWINTQDDSDSTQHGHYCSKQHQMPPNHLILCIHLPALQRASQGQTGWMLKCLVTSGKKNIQSKKGWAITTSPASEECTIAINTWCHQDNE